MRSMLIASAVIFVLSGCASKQTSVNPKAMNRSSVYIDQYHCKQLSYDSKKAAWKDVGFDITQGKIPLAEADLTKYDVLVLDQPWPSKNRPFSEDDVSAVSEYVRQGGLLFLLCEYRFCRKSPEECTRITKSFGIKINSDWVNSDTVCKNTGLVPDFANLPDWTIEDMGSSISIDGGTAIPVYKTDDDLNTMVWASFGDGHALVAGDFESFGLDSPHIYKELLRTFAGEDNIQNQMNVLSRRITDLEKEVTKLRNKSSVNHQSNNDFRRRLSQGELAELKEKAEAGDPQALNKIAWRYNKGIGVDRDLTEARKWYQILADGGDQMAMLWVGRFYKEGQGGLEKDYSKAFHWLSKCAEHVDMWAIIEIPKLYEIGDDNFPKDEVKAQEWIEKANQIAGEGNDRRYQVAQYILACEYDSGRHIPQDYKQALKWFEVSGNNGHTGAMVQAAEAYYKGKGVGVNKAKARDWLDKALSMRGESNIEFFARQFPQSERAAIQKWYEEK